MILLDILGCGGMFALDFGRSPRWYHGWVNLRGLSGETLGLDCGQGFEQPTPQHNIGGSMPAVLLEQGIFSALFYDRLQAIFGKKPLESNLEFFVIDVVKFLCNCPKVACVFLRANDNRMSGK